MEPRQNKGSDTRVRSSQNDRQTTLTLLLTMADTTWRIFTPVILCVGIGLWGDISYGTKPWLTLLAMLVGFAGAAALIWMQIKKVRNSN
jgi:F0F1-type ATP synthase assembly protein I